MFDKLVNRKDIAARYKNQIGKQNRFSFFFILWLELFILNPDRYNYLNTFLYHNVPTGLKKFLMAVKRLMIYIYSTYIIIYISTYQMHI